MPVGDPLGGRWGGHKYVSDLSLYSSSHVGLMAAVLDRTDDEKILQLNCLKTDFFHDSAYPMYLYYNSYREPREIHVDAGAAPVDLYDAISHAFASRRVRGKTPLRLAPDSAALIVLAPAGVVVSRCGDRLLVDGVIVDYHAAGIPVMRSSASKGREFALFGQ